VSIDTEGGEASAAFSRLFYISAIDPAMRMGCGKLSSRTPPALPMSSYHPNVESMIRVCDVVTINAPLHPETEHLFNDALIGKMKRGAYLVNTARGKICDRDAIVRALKAGSLPAMQATSGSRSHHRRITLGVRCPITE
jgi:hypothetical protein